MYLHEDREMFRTIVEQVAEESGKNSIVIEKDYYVTMILRLLSEQLELCVFKGGTSLSKGFHVINRFSEDIISTGNDNKYVKMDGTSMATPFNSGVAALVIQRLKKTNPNLHAMSLS